MLVLELLDLLVEVVEALHRAHAVLHGVHLSVHLLASALHERELIEVALALVAQDAGLVGDDLEGGARVGERTGLRAAGGGSLAEVVECLLLGLEVLDLTLDVADALVEVVLVGLVEALFGGGGGGVGHLGGLSFVGHILR